MQIKLELFSAETVSLDNKKLLRKSAISAQMDGRVTTGGTLYTGGS